MKFIYVLTIVVTAVVNCYAQSTTSITYIANEGVHIRDKYNSILIDALHEKYYDHLDYPDKAARNAMIEGDLPYHKVNLNLVTHSHNDHFNPILVGKFLSNSKDAILITTQQSYDSIHERYSHFEQVESRIYYEASNSGWQTYKQEEITIDFIYLRHINPRNYHIQNISFAISVDGKSILHLGDADTDMSVFDDIDWDDRKFDVALVPVWFLATEEGKAVLDKHINAKQLIGIHYPKSGGKMMLKGISQKFPNAIVFTDKGQQYSF